MGHEEPTLRLFVAVYPPEDAARRMLRLLRKLDLPRHREVPLEQVHMTVQFVGPTPVGDLEAVQESIARSVSGIGPFELRAERLMSLPRRGRVRLVAAELDRPAGLMEIQRRLAQRLARSPRERPGDRFIPHMTLCRFERGARSQDVDVAAGDEIAFAVSEIRLMKSVLRPQGAEHGVVRGFALA